MCHLGRAVTAALCLSSCSVVGPSGCLESSAAAEIVLVWVAGASGSGFAVWV